MTDGRIAIAVDGGNSKTHVALIDGEGSLLAFAKGGVSSHEWLGIPGSIAALERILQPILSDAGRDPDVGVFCLAGMDLPIDDRRVGGAIRDRAWARNCTVLNDAFAILRSGTDRDWGIAVVCGAGMNCVGISPTGSTVRFPALGEISGDLAAGGQWIGTRALGVAMRAIDGRGDRTMLEAMVPEHFGVASAEVVTESLRLEELEEAALAELTPIVFKAADAGDEVALDLLRAVASEIVIMVSAAVKRLQVDDMDPHVVLGGGVFRNRSEWFFDEISAAIRQICPAALVSVPDAPPIVGACLLALDELDADETARVAIRQALTQEHIAAGTRSGSADDAVHEPPLATR